MAASTSRSQQVEAKTSSQSLGEFMWLSRCRDSGSGRLNRNGGAGRSRTADLEFRKLLLYPSELQPPTPIIPAGNVHTWFSFPHPKLHASRSTHRAGCPDRRTDHHDCGLTLRRL